MKIYDISQEVFGCKVYPGDPMPKRERVCSIEKGELYNLTAFSMCAHNGTHIDAPYHFIKDGKTVNELPLEKTVGMAYVVNHCGMFGEDDAKEVLKTAEKISKESAKRILIKGAATVTAEAARVFGDAGIYLLGNESQTVGPENSPMEVHKILLEKEIVLLEGVILNSVKQGIYLLSAQPINLSGSDGAPCRAILIELD